MLPYIDKTLISNSEPLSFNDQTLETFSLITFHSFSYLSSSHSKTYNKRNAFQEGGDYTVC